MKKGTFIINSIAQENEVRKPLVDFLGCVRLCKPGKNGRFRPLWPLLVVVAHCTRKENSNKILSSIEKCSRKTIAEICIKSFLYDTKYNLNM